MKKSSSIFLQAIIICIGIGALLFMLWEPQLEGRNIHATLFEIYFQDPFLAYAYIASLPFFTALFQAFKLLGYTRQDRIFTERAVKALRIIKYCALACIGFVIGGEIIILFSTSDDRAGGVAMGIFIAFGSIIVATASAMCEQILQNAVDMKSENDLTV